MSTNQSFPSTAHLYMARALQDLQQAFERVADAKDMVLACALQHSTSDTLCARDTSDAVKTHITAAPASASNIIDDANKILESVTEAPPKKKRGRPRKNPAV